MNITFYLYSVWLCTAAVWVRAVFSVYFIMEEQLKHFLIREVWSISYSFSGASQQQTAATDVWLSSPLPSDSPNFSLNLLVWSWKLEHVLFSTVSPPLAAPTSCRAEADQQQVLRGPQLLSQRADQLPDGGGHGGADGCVGVVAAVDFEQNWKHEPGQTSEIWVGMRWHHCDLSQSSPNTWRRTTRSLSSLLLIGWRFCSFSSPVLNCRRKTLCCGKSVTAPRCYYKTTRVIQIILIWEDWSHLQTFFREILSSSVLKH